MYIIVFVFLIAMLYYFIKFKYSYWSAKGVKGPHPLPFFGNFLNVMLQKESLADFGTSVYNKFSSERIIGTYQGFKPYLVIKDPEIIKHILIKDFEMFQHRGIRSSSNKLNNNLFTTEGETWRILRQKLTPVFTSKKLRDMIPLIQECANKYTQYIDELVTNNKDVEIRGLAAKYTLQVIGSCAFGIDVDTLNNEMNEFSKIAAKVFQIPLSRKVVNVIDMIVPGTKKVVGFIGRSEVADFFLNLVKNLMRSRKGKLVKRHDFMDFLIELREQGRICRKTETKVTELEMDDMMMAAQALVFYSAGFETSSATMSFLLYELALNQDIQQHLYEEICNVISRHNDEITYEAVKDMNYLNMVLDETLRKHSVAGTIQRQCLGKYKIPDTNVTIDEGVLVGIPIRAFHHDPRYFPEPHIFNPERFSIENKQKIVPLTYLPFGEGPRNCIGLRFAKVQSAIGTAAFLRHFKVEPSDKTLLQLKFDPTAATLTSKNGIWLKIKKRV